VVRSAMNASACAGSAKQKRMKSAGGSRRKSACVLYSIERVSQNLCIAISRATRPPTGIRIATWWGKARSMRRLVTSPLRICPCLGHIGGSIEMSVSRANLTSTMLYAFSLPTKADKVPTGSDWLHEVKYDGCSSAIRIACG
jgi:hypothetical protein